MNERIEALAKQAAEYAIEFATQDQSLYIPKLMEKFAQLIVQECISLVNLRQKFAVEDELNAEHALDILVYDIEQHFGVEQ